MLNHSFFTPSESQQIPLEIVFDQEPPEGLKFENGKIYVNTKDPMAYKRLHLTAVGRFIEENGEKVERCLARILNEN